jgi:hypothetical protein
MGVISMGYAFCFGGSARFVPNFVPNRTDRMGCNPRNSLLEATVLPFKSARGMHDRYVALKIINAAGQSSRHILDLSGGIDHFMKEDSETRIFYFTE